MSEDELVEVEEGIADARSAHRNPPPIEPSKLERPCKFWEQHPWGKWKRIVGQSDSWYRHCTRCGTPQHHKWWRV